MDVTMAYLQQILAFICPNSLGMGINQGNSLVIDCMFFEEPLVRWKASRLAGDKCPAEREGYVAYVAVCSHVPEIEKHTFKAYNHLS